MITIVIKLDSLKKVKKFVEITNRYSGKFEVSEGKYTADGKSIMGLFSLNLKKNLSLSIESDENLLILMHELKPYII